MSVRDAKEKCPQLVLVNGEDLTRYREMSYKVTGTDYGQYTFSIKFYIGCLLTTWSFSKCKVHKSVFLFGGFLIKKKFMWEWLNMLWVNGERNV